MPRKRRRGCSKRPKRLIKNKAPVLTHHRTFHCHLTVIGCHSPPLPPSVLAARTVTVPGPTAKIEQREAIIAAGQCTEPTIDPVTPPSLLSPVPDSQSHCGSGENPDDWVDEDEEYDYEEKEFAVRVQALVSYAEYSQQKYADFRHSV